jgi:hypothetical protein
METERTEKIVSGLLAFGIAVFASWLANRIDQTPLTALIVGLSVFGFLVVALKLDWHKRIVSLFKPEAIVVSALVFDGDDILLVEEGEPRGRWVVPPSAHVRCLSRLQEGPHEAVIREIKDRAGIAIQIDRPDEDDGRGARTIPVPCFAQSERQSRSEGHATHHDFYYVGRLVHERPQTKLPGKYQWIKVKDLDRQQLVRVPKETKKIIDRAFKTWQRQNRVLS